MAFQLNGLDPSNSGSGGASLLGTYRTNDAIAAVLGAGYFNEAAPNLRWTHMLLVRASDAVSLITVSSDGDTVTTAEYSPSGGSTITWDDIEDKPEVIAAGEDAAAARAAIGAGTSNLAIGTGADDAAAGNHSHAFSSLSGSVSGATGGDLQAILEDIVTRLAVVETP